MCKVSWTAEERCQIEFVVVVVVSCDFAPEFITVLPERITDKITEQAIYFVLQPWWNNQHLLCELHSWLFYHVFKLCSDNYKRMLTGKGCTRDKECESSNVTEKVVTWLDLLIVYCRPVSSWRFTFGAIAVSEVSTAFTVITFTVKADMTCFTSELYSKHCLEARLRNELWHILNFF